MINQRHCPFCKSPAGTACAHLALAAEGRDFVRDCVERCHGQTAWRALSAEHSPGNIPGRWPTEQPDFMWLETAFCDEFLRGLRWFGGMDHEWRSGPKAEHGGFWVLLWSKDPQRLWWELREALERKSAAQPPPSETPPWLIFLAPK